MKKSTCIVLMFGVLAGNACAQGLEFKSLQLGEITTPSQVETQLKSDEAMKICGQSEGSCADQVNVSCGAGAGGMQVCNGKTTITGSPADVNVVIGVDGRLQRLALTFSNDAYDGVRDAFLKKFGKPSSVRRYDVQNGFGAQFTQVDTVWLRSGGRKLLLSRYGASTDDSVAYFSTKADRDMWKHLGDSNDL